MTRRWPDRYSFYRDDLDGDDKTYVDACKRCNTDLASWFRRRNIRSNKGDEALSLRQQNPELHRRTKAARERDGMAVAPNRRGRCTRSRSAPRLAQTNWAVRSGHQNDQTWRDDWHGNAWAYNASYTWREMHAQLQARNAPAPSQM